MFQNLTQKALFEVQSFALTATQASGNSAWSLDSFFKNVLKAIQTYGGYILMIVGAAALIWSIVQAFRKYLFQSQEVRVSAVALIAGAVFGAAFMFGGWGLANEIGTGLKETANEFGGNGSVINIPLIIEYLKFTLLK